jgi:hypothetical protein
MTSANVPMTKAERRGQRALTKFLSVFYQRLRETVGQVDRLTVQVQSYRDRVDELEDELRQVAAQVAQLESARWSDPRPGLTVDEATTVIDASYAEALQRLGDETVTVQPVTVGEQTVVLRDNTQDVVHGRTDRLD